MHSHEPTPLMAVRDLAARRAGRRVFTGVSFTIMRGEAFILRGANGAGKTTLLQTLGRRAPADAGVIETAHEGRAATTFLGHLDGVKAALTARENIAHWRRIYGADAQMTEKSIAAMNVGAFLDQRASTLSAGQRRRVAMCRPILARRAIWLLDEPTAGMDAQSVTAVISAIEDHCAQGGGAVIATHEPISLRAMRTMTLAEAS